MNKQLKKIISFTPGEFTRQYNILRYDFDSWRENIEISSKISGHRVKIDDVRTNNRKGTVEILYSVKKMAKQCLSL